MIVVVVGMWSMVVVVGGAVVDGAGVGDMVFDIDHREDDMLEVVVAGMLGVVVVGIVGTDPGTNQVGFDGVGNGIVTNLVGVDGNQLDFDEF